MKEATFQTGLVRLFPILIAALIANLNLGFMQTAQSTSDGAEMQRPLATVEIGGLLAATGPAAGEDFPI